MVEVKRKSSVTYIMKHHIATVLCREYNTLRIFLHQPIFKEFFIFFIFIVSPFCNYIARRHIKYFLCEKAKLSPDARLVIYFHEYWFEKEIRVPKSRNLFLLFMEVLEGNLKKRNLI